MTTTNRAQIIVTGQLQKDSWMRREMPPVELVRPGLWSIPVIFPDNPLRYVNVYVIEVPSGVVLVDAGWPIDAAWEALTSGLNGIGYDITDVEGVLVTHNHADHLGLAGRVREASGAWIAMHRLDDEVFDTDFEPAEMQQRSDAWLIRAGIDRGDWQPLSIDAGQFSRFWTVPRADRFIEDGEHPLPSAPSIRALWTPGHSPGHLCFIDDSRNLLLSGDCVLPRISPHISAHGSDGEDPLGTYLATLASMRGMNHLEVLPAHEYRFSGLDARIEQMHEHHEDRLAEVLEAIVEKPGASTFEISAHLSWSHGWDNTQGMLRRAAVGETLAHIVLLVRRGIIANRPIKDQMHAGQMIGPDSWFAIAS